MRDTTRRDMNTDPRENRTREKISCVVNLFGRRRGKLEEGRGEEK